MERPKHEVLDRNTYQTAEIDHLEEVIPVQTEAGRDNLRTSIVNGLPDRAAILGRQEAVLELSQDPELRDALKRAVTVQAQLGKYVRGWIRGQNTQRMYAGMREGIGGLRNFEKDAETGADITEGVASDAIGGALEDIQRFNASDIADLLRGPLYHTPGGLRSKDQLGRLTPHLRFRPGLSGRVTVPIGACIAGSAIGILPPDVGSTAPMAAVPFVYGHIANQQSGRMLKDEIWSLPTAYRPLRSKLRQSAEAYHAAYDAVGEIDLLISLSEAWQVLRENGHATVFPAIEGADVYTFQAEGLKNPLLAFEVGRQVVGNTIEFDGRPGSFTFLTGPNSGGKSTLSKAIVQNQVLAQIGSPVVAERAAMTIADKISYHVPTPPDLNDESGRFGYELGRVRTILNAATPESLTILDDCLDGTTHEERLSVLRNVITGFDQLAGGTVFSTHAHELVEEFESRGHGQFLQVAFDGENPTYRIEPGVSHTSHADRVARLHGFTSEQMAEEIRQKTGAPTPM